MGNKRNRIIRKKKSAVAKRWRKKKRERTRIEAYMRREGILPCPISDENITSPATIPTTALSDTNADDPMACDMGPVYPEYPEYPQFPDASHGSDSGYTWIADLEPALPSQPIETAASDSMQEPDANETSSIEAELPEGSRRVNLRHFLPQLQKVHGPCGCTFADSAFVKETVSGQQSTLHYKCRMCNITVRATTQESAQQANEEAVQSALVAGMGYTSAKEFMTGIDTPFMSSSTYAAYQRKVCKRIDELSQEAMLEAGREERALAILDGDVDEDGNGLIRVVTDGGWSKRSYGSNYNANSGFATIIGWRTGKVLFCETRDKYCAVCKKGQSSSRKPHDCRKNYHGSSTGMEAEIILKGFMESVKTHRLVYKELIGDGDSSVINKIHAARPYGDRVVKKTECSNHAMVRFRRNLIKIADSKGFPFVERDALKNRIERIVTGVNSATKHWREANVPEMEKVASLKRDILNSIKHCFGKHENCSRYFCDGGKDEQPIEMGPAMWQQLQAAVYLNSIHAESLLKHYTSNLCEQFNSLVAKQTGGKRSAHPTTYKARTEIAVLRRNAVGGPTTVLTKSLKGRSPSIVAKAFLKEQNGLRQRSGDAQTARRILKFTATEKKENKGPDADYGLPDVPREILREKISQHMESLRLTEEEARDLERRTRNQGQGNEEESQLWGQHRRKRLTASMYGRVVALKCSTNPATIVFEKLYRSVNTKPMQYGHANEEKAKKIFQKKTTKIVQPSGLWVHPRHPFLAASPDGIIEEEDALIEVKSSYVARETESLQEAMEKKMTPYLQWNKDKEPTIKKNHQYYYQIQGQLEITNKEKCYFVVYAENWIHIEEIARDVELWRSKMFPKLKWFYDEALCPELVEPRYSLNFNKNHIRKPDQTFTEWVASQSTS